MSSARLPADQKKTTKPDPCPFETGAMPVPRIGDTDNIPFDEKTIHQAWECRQAGFYWLIAEVQDGEEAFGYANLNSETDSEWGYISISEIRSVGSTMVAGWTPVKFPEAKRIAEASRASRR